MKRFILLLLTLFVVSTNIFAQNVRSISDQRAIMLLNYLQYSLAQISTNPTKIVAEKEFDSIINNINPSSIKDGNIIQEVDSILDTMKQIKLLDNEKKHAEEIAVRERKAAITRIFSSPGSIFVPGQIPSISLAYAALSAGLNYAGARAQIKNAKLEKEFQIAQNILSVIDSERSNLYQASAKVFKTRDDTNDLISEKMMKSFVEAVNIDNISTRKARLETMKQNLRLFPPYWYALGYMQQELGDTKAALDSYIQYETLLKNEPVLKFDEMLCQIQFAKIDIYAREGTNGQGYSYNNKNVKLIQSSIHTVQDEIKKAIPEEQAQQKFALAVMYRMFGDTAGYEQCINDVKALNYLSWNETVDAYSNQLKVTVYKANNELINRYITDIDDEYERRIKIFKSKMADLRFLQYSDESLYIRLGSNFSAYTEGFSDNIKKRIEDSDMVEIKSDGYVWNNVFSKKELEKLSSGVFGIKTENGYLYFELSNINTSVCLKISSGLVASDDVKKVEIKINGKKKELKIGYQLINLESLPKFSECMQRDKVLQDLMKNNFVDDKLKMAFLSDNAVIQIDSVGVRFLMPDSKENEELVYLISPKKF